MKNGMRDIFHRVLLKFIERFSSERSINVMTAHIQPFGAGSSPASLKRSRAAMFPA